MKDILLLTPILLSFSTGLLVMLVDILSPKDSSRSSLGYISCVGQALGALSAFVFWKGQVTFQASWLQTVLFIDQYTGFFAILILLAGMFAALLSIRFMEHHGIRGGDPYSLLSFASTGGLIFISANDLITMFLGLEVMSLSIYISCALKRSSPYSTEAGLKYFVLGGVGSAFFLFGVAFLYGTTGKLSLSEMTTILNNMNNNDNLILPALALSLLVVAFGFKVAAVPFHMWTPDVYQGSPTPITVYMAGAVKVAGFAVMVRMLLTLFQNSVFYNIPLNLEKVLLILSIITMIIGNVLGIVQTDVKRILAYSSIAHAGYILLGIYGGVNGSIGGGVTLSGAVPFYLITYLFATVGAFGILSIWSGNGLEDFTLDKIAGIGKRHPLLTGIMLVCLMSLAGIPPFGGFIAKFYLFKEVLKADIEKNLPWVIIGVLNSLVALYYYIRILVYAYFRESTQEGNIQTIHSVPGYITVGISALLSLYLGVLPTTFISISDHVARKAVIGVVSKEIGHSKSEQINQTPEEVRRDWTRRGFRTRATQ